MHITSLPGAYGVGTMGKEAYRFVDFLEDAYETIAPTFSDIFYRYFYVWLCGRRKCSYHRHYRTR